MWHAIQYIFRQSFQPKIIREIVEKISRSSVNLAHEKFLIIPIHVLCFVFFFWINNFNVLLHEWFSLCRNQTFEISSSMKHILLSFNSKDLIKISLSQKENVNFFTYFQMGWESSYSCDAFRRFIPFVAEDVDPRGDRDPPSGSPIKTSVRPFSNGLLDRRSVTRFVWNGCCWIDFH